MKRISLAAAAAAFALAGCNNAVTVPSTGKSDKSGVRVDAPGVNVDVNKKSGGGVDVTVGTKR